MVRFIDRIFRQLYNVNATSVDDVDLISVRQNMINTLFVEYNQEFPDNNINTLEDLSDYIGMRVIIHSNENYKEFTLFRAII